MSKAVLAVLTGDVINSRKAAPKVRWKSELKAVLSHYGSEGKDWDLFRGDSFQLVCSPEKALYAALHIKSRLRSSPPLDARIAIGLGEVSGEWTAVAEASGPAFITSGHAFDSLPLRKKNVVFVSEREALDREMSILLSLGSIIWDHWSATSSQTVCALLRHPGYSQQQLAQLFGISQPSVSARLKVAYADEIKALLAYISQRLTSL